MRNFITITIILTSTFFCKGQSLNLVPVDPSNIEIIADTVFDKYSFVPDSIKFNLENYKVCPCLIDSEHGLVSYKSSSFLIKRNECLFIYKVNFDFYINVGQMTKKRDEHGECIWRFSTERLKDKIAKEYISMIKNEINKAEIPRFKNHVIVMDGTDYTFGDIEQNEFATTPRTYFSDSVIELIKFSERLIKKTDKLCHMP
jgi:hypothetical protein